MNNNEFIVNDSNALSRSDDQLRQLYGRLQSFLNWTPADAEAMSDLKPLVQPAFAALVDDFYEEIARHAATRSVIAGPEQVQRLKDTLIAWLSQLFGGVYDLEFVKTRWRVGHRHVQIGLDQTYATAALGRLRAGLHDRLHRCLADRQEKLSAALKVMNKMLDMDCAIINSAYQISYARLMEETAQKQMQQSERLAAIGQMVTGLAHESRNALQRSHACLETLVLDIEDRPAALNLVKRVQTALDQLHTLYEEVRNYAAPIKLEREAVSLAKLVASSWNHLQHRWQAEHTTLEILVEAAADFPLLIDRIRMDQVITNLLQNAIDACGAHGKIVCQIARAPESVIQCSIADNGPGIEVRPMHKIFEPFLTTKTKGTGLGLAIAKRIVEAHQGSIQVESNHPRGAKFRVLLPLPLETEADGSARMDRNRA